MLWKYLKQSISELSMDLGSVFLFKKVELRGSLIKGLIMKTLKSLYWLNLSRQTTSIVTLLKQIEHNMRVSLKCSLANAIKTYSTATDMKTWCRSQILQVSKTAKLIHWTHSVEQALKSVDSDAMKKLINTWQGQLLYLVKICRNTEEAKERKIVTQILQILYWTLESLKDWSTNSLQIPIASSGKSAWDCTGKMRIA